MSSSSPPSPTTVPGDPHNKDSWYPYSNGAHFNGNIAMILIFILCALICALALNAAIRFFLHMSRQEQQEQQQQQEATQGADGDKANQSRNHPSPLHSLPTLVFSSGTKMKLAGCGGGGDAAECAICLSEFVEGEGVRILPKCKHGFHVKCIQGWLSSHLSCPTCRTTCLTTTTTTSPANRTDDDDEERYDVESPPPPPPPAAAAAASEPQVALLMLQRPS